MTLSYKKMYATLLKLKKKYSVPMLTLVHCFFMSLSVVLIKIMQSHYQIIQITFCYNLIICLVLGIFSVCSHSHFFKISFNDIGYHFLRSIFGFIGFLLFFYTISNMNITDARVIVSIDSIITSLLAVFFFKESINFNKILAFVTAFCATIILLHPSNIPFSIESISAFFAVICLGIFNNITKKIVRSKSIEQIFYLAFFSLIYAFIPSTYYWNSSIWSKHLLIIVFIAFAIIVGSCSSFYALKNTEFSLFIAIHFIGIVSSVITGYFIFHEIPSYLTILGSFIIILGNISLLKEKHSSHKY